MGIDVQAAPVNRMAFWLARPDLYFIDDAIEATPLRAAFLIQWRRERAITIGLS